MPYVRTSDGISLHYEVDDFRDPWADPSKAAYIIMHHGIGRNLKWWTQWVPVLSRHYVVVRYDCRGCGESTVPSLDAKWSAERLAQDGREILDALEIKRAHWVGFESGGIFGMVFAGAYPDRIRSLTLVNTPTSRWTQSRMTDTMRGRSQKVSDAIDSRGFRGWLQDTMATRLDLRYAPPELLDWHVNEHAKTPTSVAKAIMEVVENLDADGLPERILAPTLIMTGALSPSCPPSEQRELQSRIKNAQPVVVFPDIAAGIQILIPDQCTEVLMSFLANLPSDTPQ